MKPRLIKHFLCSFLIACGTLWSIAITADPDREEICNDFWREIIFSQQSHAGVESKIRAWKMKAKQCGETGLYEFRLANLYIQARQYSEAERTLNSALANKPSQEKVLQIGLVDIDLAKGNWNEAEMRLLEIVKKYPDWYLSYQKLGVVKMEKKEIPEAIEYLKKSNDREQHAATYAELVVAYHQLQNHEETVKAMNAAFELDQSVISDREAMLSASMSYTALGKFEVSKNLLGMLLKARPELRDDAGFQQALHYLSRSMKSTN